MDLDSGWLPAGSDQPLARRFRGFVGVRRKLDLPGSALGSMVMLLMGVISASAASAVWTMSSVS
jgi:hypothetical protein